MIHFQDENIIVATKEQGMLVQRDDYNETSFIDEISNIVNQEIFLINRLDRGVGGLVLFGKTRDAAGILSNISIEKKYLAVVTGIPKEEDLLEDYLFKNQRLNISKVVNRSVKGSKYSALEYKRIKSVKYNEEDISLLEISLKTGRHHQIRVQLSNRGFGIFGDDKYNKTKIRNVNNMGLWSYKIEFIHPFTNEKVNIVSEPKDVFPFSLFELAMLQIK